MLLLILQVATVPLQLSTGVLTFTIPDVPNDTGELTEGSNLYYTDARARAAVSAQLVETEV